MSLCNGSGMLTRYQACVIFDIAHLGVLHKFPKSFDQGFDTQGETTALYISTSMRY